MEGFRIQNGGGTEGCSIAGCGNGIGVYGGIESTTININNVQIRNNDYGGLYVAGDDVHLTVTNSDVLDNLGGGVGSYGIGGIYYAAASGSLAVRGCTIADNERNGIETPSGPATIRIEQNTICGNGRTGIDVLFPGGIRVDIIDNSVFQNNQNNEIGAGGINLVGDLTGSVVGNRVYDHLQDSFGIGFGPIGAVNREECSH